MHVRRDARLLVAIASPDDRPGREQVRFPFGLRHSGSWIVGDESGGVAALAPLGEDFGAASFGRSECVAAGGGGIRRVLEAHQERQERPTEEEGRHRFRYTRRVEPREVGTVQREPGVSPVLLVGDPELVVDHPGHCRIESAREVRAVAVQADEWLRRGADVSATGRVRAPVDVAFVVAGLASEPASRPLILVPRGHERREEERLADSGFGSARRRGSHGDRRLRSRGNDPGVEQGVRGEWALESVVPGGSGSRVTVGGSVRFRSGQVSVSRSAVAKPATRTAKLASRVRSIAFGVTIPCEERFTVASRAVSPDVGSTRCRKRNESM